MNWSEGAAQEASSADDYGRVIELARRADRMTQRQLGDACGLSQSAISRMETETGRRRAHPCGTRRTSGVGPQAMLRAAGPVVRELMHGCADAPTP